MKSDRFFTMLTMIDELQGNHVTVTLITGSNTICMKVNLGVSAVANSCDSL